jgi:hypothetical protein
MTNTRARRTRHCETRTPAVPAMSRARRSSSTGGREPSLLPVLVSHASQDGREAPKGVDRHLQPRGHASVPLSTK